MSELQDVKKAQ